VPNWRLESARFPTTSTRTTKRGLTPRRLNKDYDDLSAEVQKKEAARSIAQRAADLADAAFAAGVSTGVPGSNRTAGSSRPQEHPQDRENRAFAAWLKDQSGLQVSEDEQNLCAEYGYAGRRQLDLQLLNTREHRRMQQEIATAHVSRRGAIMNAALTSTTGSSGAFSIPAETFIRTMEINMLAYGSVMQVADIVTTSTGEKLVW
jgi:hypothetical protein